MINEENDKQVLKLKSVVEGKSEELKKLKKKFIKDFKTNLILNFEGETYNLNVIPIELLHYFLIRFTLFRDQADKLKIEYKIGRVSIDDYIHDIEIKLREKDIAAKERKLKHFEQKLDEKLSKSAKTKMDIDSIDDELNSFEI